jgi:hypothetical protein
MEETDDENESEPERERDRKRDREIERGERDEGPTFPIYRLF